LPHRGQRAYSSGGVAFCYWRGDCRSEADRLFKLSATGSFASHVTKPWNYGELGIAGEDESEAVAVGEAVGDEDGLFGGDEPGLGEWGRCTVTSKSIDAPPEVFITAASLA
jgi:hypothetical protein